MHSRPVALQNRPGGDTAASHHPHRPQHHPQAERARTERREPYARLDEPVFARSVFHHPANNRSAVMRAQGRLVTDPREKLDSLQTLVEHLTPGSWLRARQPSAKELAATVVPAIDTTEASVKARTGPPVDNQSDVDAATAWAGVLPLQQNWGAPQPCELLPIGSIVPLHVGQRPDPR